MKRFLNDIQKYWSYTKYSAKSGLKSEVANSHLSWLWWILDPLLFMLVYTFIAMIVFSTNKEFFPIFVFVGLNMWSFFNKTTLNSVKIVTNNRAVVSKVYIPKYMLIITEMLQQGFKMLISFSLVIVMMLIWKVPITVNILYFFPIMITLAVITFGISTIVSHFGVFVEDLRNIMQVILRLCFYMSGIFYAIEDRIKDPYLSTIMLKCNPIAFLMNSCRNSLLYSSTPHRKLLLLWFLIGLGISAIGIRIIYKHENSYVKVI